MATYYWVGGSGTWSTSSGTNWSLSSGGAGGAGVPTSTDDVIFDANSNTGTNNFTVTISSTYPPECRSFTASGLDGVMTLAFGSAGVLSFYGNWSSPASNFATTSSGSGARLIYKGSGSSTLTTNNVTLFVNIYVDTSTGTLTLGSDLTLSTLSPFYALDVTQGTFSTSASNYSLTAASLRSSNSNARTINLNGSTVTVTVLLDFQVSINFTFNAGTSSIVFSPDVYVGAPFYGGNNTFYNVSFTNAVQFATVFISGTNTFNNLSFTSIGVTGIKTVTFTSYITVNGTLTFGASNTPVRRMSVTGSGSSKIYIALNGTLAPLSDVDFRNVVTLGAAGTWTGTRLGDGTNNSGITFDAPKTVYWNLAGTQNWSATGWATTNNGVPAVNNFPLAQDTAVFTEAGSADTVVIDYGLWWVGTIQMEDGVSNRTTAFTLKFDNNLVVYGNLNFFPSLITSGSSPVSLNLYGNTNTTIKSSGASNLNGFRVNKVSGKVTLLDNYTAKSTEQVGLGAGTLDLNDKTITCGIFRVSNGDPSAIFFGTGNITITGNNTTVFEINPYISSFSYTGTPTINVTYAGSVGTRTLNQLSSSVNHVFNVNVTAGTDTVVYTNFCKDLNFTGFSGTLSNSSRTIYGNLTVSSGMTLVAGTQATTFSATSGTQDVTTNGKTLDFPITINGAGGTVRLQDGLTLGATRSLTLTNGTLNLNGLSLLTDSFVTASGTKNITFNGGTLSISGSGATAWNNAQPTNFTTTAGTGTGAISMTSASAKTFVGGGSTYNCNLNQGGAGALTITGSNTFNSITNTTQPATVTFTSGTTQTVSNFGLSGTLGNLITINSTTPGSQATLSKSSGTVGAFYLSIQDSNAVGGATWNAYNSSSNGNNTGWNFISFENGMIVFFL